MGYRRPHLSNLTDVEPSGKTDGAILRWDAESGKHAYRTLDMMTVAGLSTALDEKASSNTPIEGATRTKVTYDSHGFIIAGDNATTADITDTSDRRYVTDANLEVLNQTSGVNTGDQDLSGFSTVGHGHTIGEITDAVTSVNGLIGSVTLGYSDVGAAPVTHHHTISDTTGLLDALDGKASLSHTHTTSQISDLPVISQTSMSNALAQAGTGGTIADGFLSSNIPRLNAANTFTANQIISGNVSATRFISDGGSAASPSIKVGNAENGLYSDGLNVKITSNGNERATINNIGMLLTNSVANNSSKNTRYCGYHYTNSEEPTGGLIINSSGGSNAVLIGGGSSAVNAATSVQVYAAANSTTLTGTEVATFNTSGLSVNGSGMFSEDLYVSKHIDVANRGLSGIGTDGNGLYIRDGSNVKQLTVYRAISGSLIIDGQGSSVFLPLKQSGSAFHIQDNSFNNLFSISLPGGMVIGAAAQFNSSVAIGRSNPNATLHSTGSTILGVATSAVADANLGNGQINPHLDESGGNLVFKIKTSTGSVKTVTIPFDN